MTKQNTEPKYVLPGEQIELNGKKMRVLDRDIKIPGGDNTFEVLNEIKYVAAFVGRRHAESGYVLDSFPLFTATEYGRELTATQAGLVLFTDIVRDLVTENRVSKDNFTVGHIDQLDSFVLETYGEDTAAYLARAVGGKVIGRETARFIAKRLARILKVNYPNAAADVSVDDHRVLLTKPFKRLVNVDAGYGIKSLADFATYLGGLWLEASRALTTKRNPAYGDRSELFAIVDDGQPETEVLAA